VSCGVAEQQTGAGDEAAPAPSLLSRAAKLDRTTAPLPLLGPCQTEVDSTARPEPGPRHAKPNARHPESSHAGPLVPGMEAPVQARAGCRRLTRKVLAHGQAEQQHDEQERLGAWQKHCGGLL